MQPDCSGGPSTAFSVRKRVRISRSRCSGGPSRGAPFQYAVPYSIANSPNGRHPIKECRLSSSGSPPLSRKANPGTGRSLSAASIGST